METSHDAPRRYRAKAEAPSVVNEPQRELAVASVKFISKAKLGISASDSGSYYSLIDIMMLSNASLIILVLCICAPFVLPLGAGKFSVAAWGL